ncbi:phage portal protein [Brevibacillus choshinensis]|uniref:phage portal protein n=1 Tax=Brevibacillus choshinensis TaxID=54911 RepID=UPI002E236BD2|nr:phage portal protein [Brevibacillus choshinensis]MED4586664.1 phage portal protein [Brevibacillus choshinensis]
MQKIRGLLNVKNLFPWEQTLWDTFSSPASSGENVSATNALTVGAIYACVNIKANAIAKLPLQVFRNSSNGRERDTKHQVSYLLETRPNPHMTPFVFKHTVTVHRNLWGNAYIRMTFDSFGNVTRLDLLDPAKVQTLQDLTGRVYYQYTDNKKVIVYDPDELIVLPYLSTDGLAGKSPIAIARETAGTMISAQKFLGSFYKNGTTTRGVLKVPTQLDKPAKDKVRQSWSEANSGSDNAHRIAVLDGGIEYQNLTMPLQDAEFIASQKFNIAEIARIFNVPLHKLNELDRATFSNIEQQSMEFVQDCIQPEIVAWEEEFNYKLFTTNEQKHLYVKFNLTSALRGDSASRATYYKEMLAMGAMTINQVRELEEQNAMDNGDRPLVSLNYTFLDTLEAYQAAKSGWKGGENSGKEE